MSRYSRSVEGFGQSPSKVVRFLKEYFFPREVVRGEKPAQHSNGRLENVHGLSSNTNKRKNVTDGFNQ